MLYNSIGSELRRFPFCGRKFGHIFLRFGGFRHHVFSVAVASCGISEASNGCHEVSEKNPRIVLSEKCEKTEKNHKHRAFFS